MQNPTLPKNLSAFIWRFVKLQRCRFFFIYFSTIVWPLDATVWPYLIRRIIDTFSQYDGSRGAALPALKWLLIAGIALWVVIELGFRMRNFLSVSAFPKLEAEIRMAMFDHIQHHSPKYFNEHFAGSLANKISDMTTQVSMILKNLTIFVPALLASVLSLIFAFQVSPLVAVIMAIWIVLHFSICLAFTPKCIKYSHDHGEARSALAGKIVDSLTNNFAVNLFFRFQFEKARIIPFQKDERKKNDRAQRYVAWMFVLLGCLFFLCGIGFNGVMVLSWLKGAISTGKIIQIFNMTFSVAFVVWFAGEQIPQFFQSIGIAKQALSVMQDPKDVVDLPKAEPLVICRGEIVFEDVSFHYGKKALFRNKNVRIKGGEKVGLVGYSGAGKSTFVNLILRFHSIEGGRILIDGQDIADVTLESLRNQVALIPQDPLLFHRSLMENIHYGRITASADEVIEAAKLAHCDEFVKKSHDGYESLVGERGTKLSGGERQRIAMARAILAKAPILILDEATSALDSVTESYIQDSLEKLMQNRTTIVIAHRLSTLAKMDRILVFDQGKVVEEGSHQELLAKNSHYAQMWRMQAGGFLPEIIDEA